MIHTRLSTHDRRALLLGIFAILLLVSGKFVIPRLARWTAERSASAAELEAQVMTLQSDARSQRETLDSLARRKALLAIIDSGALAGESEAAASAALGEVMNAALAESGVMSNATQFATDSGAAGARYRSARVRLSAQGDIHGLTRLFSALERGPKILTVRSLSVTQPQLAAPDSLAEALNIELIVEGIVRRPDRSGSPACNCKEPNCDCSANAPKMGNDHE